MASLMDELGLNEETPRERLARELAENDLELVAALRRVREHLKLSQGQLGERLGVSQAAVSDFESGSSEPKLSTVRRYAFALGATVEHTVRLDEVEFCAPRGGSATWTPAQPFRNFTRATPAHLVSFAAEAKRTDFALSA